MKLNFRDLKQQKFTIDAEPTDTILQVKEKIAEDKGWDASLQKLIYSGKILADSATVESYKIEEKGFIVCMVNKPKAAPAAKAAPPATPQAASSSTPAPPAAPQQSTTTPAVSNNPPATPSPAQSAQVPVAGQPQAGFGNSSTMLVGNNSESVITEMQAMGFERPEIERALRAAFYNPDRAIEYLLNGIPDNIQAEQRQAAQQQQQQQQAAPTSPTPAAAGTTGTGAATAQPLADEPVNLFEAAAQAGQTQGGAGGRGGARSAGTAAGAGAGLEALAGAAAPQGGQQVNMDFLRQSEHFQHLRRLVQQQPAMLEPILQQVAAGNPQLAQLIGQNSEAFLQLLSEEMAGEGGPVPPGHIQVTQAEADAIDRLCGLGFPRDRVIQAYFACDKNEELAANFLFHDDDDDDEQM